MIDLKKTAPFMDLMNWIVCLEAQKKNVQFSMSVTVI